MEQEILKRALAYVKKHKVPLSHIGRAAADNSHVLKRIQDGFGCSTKTYAKIDAWLTGQGF